MTSEQVAVLEQRATAAELAIEELKKSIAAQSFVAGASGSALEDKLRRLLQLMYEDRKECEAIRARRDELLEENERLREQVAKHEYRIGHLLRTINEIESRQ